ncbi:MAG: 30S ribosomal protein S8 [Planctomycetota bacterium]
MMTDPIADMLTRIRNGLRIERQSVKMPHSRIKEGIAEVLKREGYIRDFRESTDESGKKSLTVFLKYGPDGENVVIYIQRVSRPGCRIYRRCDELKPVLNGLGIQVVSTSKGVKSDRECREERLGGEVLCKVY